MAQPAWVERHAPRCVPDWLPRRVLELEEMSGSADPIVRSRAVQTALRWHLDLCCGELHEGTGPELAPLHERREVMMKEQLERELSRDARSRVAVVYGACHMPEFERWLAGKGYVLVSSRWFEAWRAPAHLGGRRPVEEAQRAVPGEPVAKLGLFPGFEREVGTMARSIEELDRRVEALRIDVVEVFRSR